MRFSGCSDVAQARAYVFTFRPVGRFDSDMVARRGQSMWEGERVIRKYFVACISGCLLLQTILVMQAAEDRSRGYSVAIWQSMTG